MKRLTQLVIFLFVFLLLFNCEKNITTQCETEPTVEARLSSIQKNVFDPYCVGCHSGAAAQGNLDLSAGKAYSNLVNVPSSASGLKRVVPGNSAQSYLMKRLTGADGETIMPPGGKLSQPIIDAIQKWIDDGAKDN